MYGDHVADNIAMAKLNLLFVLLRRHSDKTNDDDDDNDDDEDEDDDRYMIRKYASSRTRTFVVSYEHHNLHDPALLTAA
jgi:hypothetical protein